MADALQNAILSHDVDVVSYLLSAGVHVNRVCADGRTALNTAIMTGDDVIIMMLLDADADIDLPDSFRVDCARLQPIHYAARHDRLDLVQNFLSRDVNIDQPDEGNCTPLHHAAAKGNLDIVLYLVEAGSDINWQSNSGRTPVWKAAESGHRDLVQMLYAMGGSLNLPNKVGENVIFEVIRFDHLLPILEDVIQLGVDVKCRDIEGNTALHKACALGKLKACELLIAAGLDVSSKNDYGNTALHNAAMMNHIPCVRYLLNQTGNKAIGSLNNAGHSPLFVSMMHQHREATALLHDDGARLTPRELETFLQNEAGKNASKSAFWVWCSGYFGTTKSLTTSCVRVIRDALSVPIEQSAQCLPIPGYLQKRVCLQDTHLH